MSGINGYDIGTVDTNFLNPRTIDTVIRQGHEGMPNIFPRDRLNEKFPISLLCKQLPNGEKVKRDWLVWSSCKNAFFCLPCRLFSRKTISCSSLPSACGYSKVLLWKECYEKFPAHENCDDHIQCYMKWRELRIKTESSIHNLIADQIRTSNSLPRSRASEDHKF